MTPRILGGFASRSSVVLDGAVQAVELLLDLVALQAGEALEAHLQDGRGLLRAKAEARDHALRSLGVGTGGADDVDDLVDIVQRQQQALQDVGAGSGLGQVVLGAPRHDVEALQVVSM